MGKRRRFKREVREKLPEEREFKTTPAPDADASESSEGPTAEDMEFFASNQNYSGEEQLYARSASSGNQSPARSFAHT